MEAPGCQVAAQPHRDRAGRNLGKTGGNDQMRLGNRAGQPRRKRERNSQTVRHPDDHIADGVSGGKVLFNMWRHCHTIPYQLDRAVGK